MTNKIECDECHKLTEKQFVSLVFKENAIDMGIEIVPHSYLGLDFCSLKERELRDERILRSSGRS